MCVLLPQMRAFIGLVLLVTSTYGLDSMCDATQDAACYGALGGPVYLQLMRNTRGHQLSLHYDSTAVFKFRRSKSVFSNEFNTPSVLQRWQFVPDNGTMIINPAERRDAGTYRVEITEESTGKGVKHTVQLTIEAPVSDVDLSISCSAYGKRRAICSSNGDSPQYSWSLDGKPLDETSTNQCTENPANNKAHSNVSDYNIGDNKKKTSPDVQKDSPPVSTPSGSAKTSESSPGCSTDLLEGTQGNLTCSARNHISSASKTQPLPSCTTANDNGVPKTTTSPKIDFIYHLGAAGLGGVVFLCVSVAAFCIYKKKKKNTPTDGQSQDVVYSQCRKNPSSPPGDSYELQYAEVSIRKRRERTREDDTVEYGEIRPPGSTNHTPAGSTNHTTAEAPGSTNHTPAGSTNHTPAEPTNHTPAEESVYAQVRKKGQR